MKLRSILTVAVAIFSLTLAQSARANLVTNGDFQTGSFSGWTQFGNTGFSQVDSNGFASLGGSFGPAGSPGGIQQSIATTASQQYYVSFYLRNDGYQNVGYSSFAADFGATNIMSVANWPGAISWTGFGGTFTASGASTNLKFTFQHDPAWWHLDNVSVTAVASNVPDATATMGLILVSLAGLVGLRRKFN